MRNFTPALLAALFLFSLQFDASAQTRIQIKQAGSGLNGAKPSSPHYYYLFENERFTTPVQEIEFDSSGQGKFRFKRKGSEEIVLDLSISPALMSQIQLLFNELNFIASTENYQHKKDFSHLGTVTISLARDGKERSVKFNYTDNQVMNSLREIFQNIAIQETRIFEMETIRANDPISTPAQLRLLESEMKSKHIADPNRFVPILEDIKLDEGVPLIARNHAERLLLSIRKTK